MYPDGDTVEAAAKQLADCHYVGSCPPPGAKTLLEKEVRLCILVRTSYY